MRQERVIVEPDVSSSVDWTGVALAGTARGVGFAETLLRVPKSPVQAVSFAVGTAANIAGGSSSFSDSSTATYIDFGASVAGVVTSPGPVSAFLGGYQLVRAIKHLPVYGTDQNIGEWWQGAVWGE